MNRKLLLVAAFAGLVFLSSTVRAQVDDICREFGIIPSLDKPWDQVPYLYGRVVLNGFDAAAKPKVTVILSDRNNASDRISVSKTGNYCYRRSGSGGSLVVEVDGVEVARRTIPTFGVGQHREDFDIHPTGANRPVPPAAVTAKYSHPRNEKTVELYQNAAKAEKAKDYGAAIEHLKQIVMVDPADFIAWSILGSLHLEQKSYDEADAAFRKSLALKVEYAPAWVSVGRLRVAQKQTEAAIEIFKHAITLEPESARTYKLLGETYLQAKQGSLAVDALNQSIKLDPVGMADSHLLLARLYDLAGAKPYATREYKAFLSKVPNYEDKKKLEKYIKENPE